MDIITKTSTTPIVPNIIGDKTQNQDQSIIFSSLNVIKIRVNRPTNPIPELLLEDVFSAIFPP